VPTEYELGVPKIRRNDKMKDAGLMDDIIKPERI
jgi:hypothetical protein